MAKANAAKSAKCTCNPGWLILALIFFSVGLYAVVGGFVGQFTGSQSSQYILAWYFVGFLLIAIGKMLKWKSHGTCPVHKMPA